MDPAYYNTVQDLELRNSLEGDLLLIGYDEKLAFSILSEMVNGKLVKRDIKVVDDFAKVPWQKAFDFSNEVKNKIKKHGEYVKQSSLDAKSIDVSKTVYTIISLDEPSTLAIYKDLFPRINIDSIIHIRDKQAGVSPVIMKSIPEEFMKSKALKTPTGEVTVIKTISEVKKVKQPVRSRSELT